MAFSIVEILEVLEMLGVFSVPLHISLVFVAIMLATFGLIVTERVNKTLIVISGAAAIIAAGKIFSAVYWWMSIVNQIRTILTGVPYEFLFSDKDIFSNMIEWNSLFIIVSVMIIAVVAERSGLFEYISIRVIQLSGGNFRRLFVYICSITFVLCMILNNDPAFILMGALIIVISRTMRKNAVPYMLGAVMVSNTASASTVVAGFVNIIVASFYNYDPFLYLSYPTYITLGLPLALITTFVVIVFLILYFRNDFQIPQDKKSSQKTKRMLEQLDPSSVIEDRKLFRKTTYLLIATIAGFVIGGLVGVPLYLIALVAAAAFLASDIKELKNNILKVDWELILFLIGIFIIIGGVNSTGVLSSFGEAIGYLAPGNILNMSTVLMMFSGLLSGILPNISVAALLLYIVPSMSSTALVSQRLIIWSIIYGVSLGANLTPIGGVPNIIAFSLLKEEKTAISWKSFIKIGLPITLITLVIGILMLVLFNSILGWSYFGELIFNIFKSVIPTV
jgi:Na+/H+ antiporter NhaD/arsenite permease-like protein